MEKITVLWVATGYHFFQDGKVYPEDCQSVTNTNGDGRAGFENPYCSVDLRPMFLSTQIYANVGMLLVQIQRLPTRWTRFWFHMGNGFQWLCHN